MYTIFICFSTSTNHNFKYYNNVTTLLLGYIFYSFIHFFKTFYIRNISQGGKTPDDALFRYLSIKYASKNPKMANGSACQEEHFKNGITNGAEWYELEGGC